MGFIRNLLKSIKNHFRYKTLREIFYDQPGILSNENRLEELLQVSERTINRLITEWEPKHIDLDCEPDIILRRYVDNMTWAALKREHQTNRLIISGCQGGRHIVEVYDDPDRAVNELLDIIL